MFLVYTTHTSDTAELKFLPISIPNQSKGTKTIALYSILPSEDHNFKYYNLIKQTNPLKIAVEQSLPSWSLWLQQIWCPVHQYKFIHCDQGAKWDNEDDLGEMDTTATVET